MLRIENRSKTSYDVDPVVHVSLEIFGFKHAGSYDEIDTDFFVSRHYLMNVAEPSVKVIYDYRANPADVKVVEESKVSVPTKIINTIKEIKSNLVDKTKSIFSDAVSPLKKK